MSWATYKLAAALGLMVLAVLGLRYTHHDLFFLVFLIGLVLSILWWLDLGHLLRNSDSPASWQRVLGIFLGLPQAILGLACVVAGGSIIVWAIWNTFVRREPAYSGGFLTLGIGPMLVLFGAGWMVYAFRRQPVPGGADRPTTKLGALFREVVSRSFGAILSVLGIGGIGAVLWALLVSERPFEWGYVGAVVVSIIVLLMGWARLFPSYYAPIPVDHDDPLMKEATAQAHRELDRFRQGVRDGRKQPFVKFPLTAPSGETEHIWGIVHTLDDSTVQVSLANDPVHAQGQRDLRFSVPLAGIEDWILVDNNAVTEGGYTHLALARLYKREKGYVPRGLRKQLTGFKDLDLELLW